MFISLVTTTVGVVISFSGYAAHAYIYNRIVREVDRTFTQGIRSSVVRALGTLPSPLIFGWVIDKFCTVWRVSDDGVTGNCWLYDIDRFEHSNLRRFLRFINVVVGINGRTTISSVSKIQNTIDFRV